MENPGEVLNAVKEQLEGDDRASDELERRRENLARRLGQKATDDIYDRFLDYKSEGDFVGMDVARKYLQMGYIRSRRYAKYGGGYKSKPLESADTLATRQPQRLPQRLRPC